VNDLVIVPSDGEGYVELSRTKSGRLFRKHILNKGELHHPAFPGTKIKVDDDFVTKLTKNFQDNVCDIVQVPVANDKNEHSEDPTRNIGEVIGIEEKDNKVYALIDARDKASADKLGKTMLGASAMMHLNYTNTKTGQRVGPTLLHVCVTNRPYVTELDGYEEIVLSHADNSDEAVLLTGPTLKENDDMQTLEEMLDALKDEHGIDVLDLQKRAKEGAEATKLSNTLAEALTATGLVQLSAGASVDNDKIVSAVSEMATGYVAMSNRLEDVEKIAAEAKVDALVTEGKVLPAQRDVMVELSLKQPEMFEKLVPAEALVKLSNESGTGEAPGSSDSAEIDVDAAIKRYADMVTK
jgi:hypothetical protein